MRSFFDNHTRLLIVPLMWLFASPHLSFSQMAPQAVHNPPSNAPAKMVPLQLSNKTDAPTAQVLTDYTLRPASTLPNSSQSQLIPRDLALQKKALNTPDGLSVDELVTKINSARTTRWSDLSSAAQAIALATALFYFLYRVSAGSYNTAMTIGLSSNRVPHLDKHSDLLVTRLTMEHGEHCSLHILAAEAKIASIDSLLPSH